jgi:hypothetical protein
MQSLEKARLPAGFFIFELTHPCGFSGTPRQQIPFRLSCFQAVAGKTGGLVGVPGVFIKNSKPLKAAITPGEKPTLEVM